MSVGLQASANTLVTFSETTEMSVGFKMTESESTKKIVVLKRTL